MFGFIKKLFGPEISSINAREAQKQLSTNPRPLLLDVRQPDEYKSGHAPDARLIPLNELNLRLGELPKNKEILVICATGNRSRSATRQLVKAGFKATNISGGMSGWKQAGFPIKPGMKK